MYINSAPSSLELHHGPLCQSLSEAGGPELQAACLDYVVKHGKVKAGSVAVTVGAKLKCKNVVHVVGKEYDGPGGSADRVNLRLLSNFGYILKQFTDYMQTLQILYTCIPPICLTYLITFSLSESTAVVLSK